MKDNIKFIAKEAIEIIVRVVGVKLFVITRITVNRTLGNALTNIINIRIIFSKTRVERLFNIRIVNTLALINTKM